MVVTGEGVFDSFGGKLWGNQAYNRHNDKGREDGDGTGQGGRSKREKEIPDRDADADNKAGPYRSGASLLPEKSVNKRAEKCAGQCAPGKAHKGGNQTVWRKGDDE